MTLLASTYFDLKHRRIPNVVTFGAAAVALMLHAALEGPDGIWIALGGWGVGLAILLPGFLLGFTGAGDVKLMAAVGAFLGPESVLYAALASILAGSLMAASYMTYLAVDGEGVTPWRRYRSMLRFLWVTGRPTYLPPAAEEVMDHRFPYALAIAAGTLGVIGWELLAA
jgi:prepilin peptidase CpaA